MRLTDEIWLVGSGGVGFSLTNAHDCHVYLVCSGTSGVLIDAGCGLELDRILAEIDNTGIERSIIDRVLITHAHVDHAGGAGALSRALGARVSASAEVAAILRSADGVAASFDRMKGPGAYPDDFDYLGCAEVDVIAPGERIALGSLELEVLAASGHSAGHLAYLLHRPGGTDLFSGDAVFGLGRILLQDIWDCSLAESTATVRLLTALRPDGLFPGHGIVALNDGWMHLYSAMSEIVNGLPPRQLTF